MKKIYLYGNWKMNMLPEDTESFYREFAREVASGGLRDAMGKTLEVAVFPPFTSLGAALASGAMEKGTDRVFVPILGAQNVYHEPQGAFTGEVSVSMLKKAGCTHVIVGHSERRTLCGETDRTVAQKVEACLNAALTPVFCYGETLAEREENRTFDVAGRQLRALSGLGGTALGRIVYAYEPVWAIGTGKSATAQEAQEVCAYGKKLVQELAGGPVPLVMLYGGSVKPDNARELLAMDSIDGALVGGASLKANTFLQIYRAYAGI